MVRSGSSTTVLTLPAVAILGAAWWLGAADRSPVITTTVVLAALAFLLFRLAEDDLSPGAKAIARRWMMPVEGKVQVSAIEAFNAMFEAVFGRRHFSWFCFWRSAGVSAILFGSIMMTLDWLIYDNGLRRSILDSKIHLNHLFLLAILVNVIGDYFSLLETRVLLRIIRRHKFALEIAIFADAILTGLLFLFGFW